MFRNLRHRAVRVQDGLVLQLHRYVPEGGVPPERLPVLLLHGASASHSTFTTPAGGIARWLATEGHGFEPYDVWLLDWRGSNRILDRENRTQLDDASVFSFNAAARHDVPAAIRYITWTAKLRPISAIGFCMGGAILAEAIALGHIAHADVNRVVLMTMGLFYETPIDGRLKSEERVLERLKGTAIGKPPAPFLSLNPSVSRPMSPGKFALRQRWPIELEGFYDTWPKQLRYHLDDDRQPFDEMCNRLSFMLGMFYEHENLNPGLHADGDDCVAAQFGPMALNLFIHGARNVRVGHATYYPDTPPDRSDSDFVSDAARERFTCLDNVTLITGARNRLWHRDSIDRMYEWLCRDGRNRGRFQKHVLEKYGHQDLLWGCDSPTEVFPRIEQGLRAQ